MLEVTDSVRVEDLFIRTRLTDNFSRADLTVTFDLDALESKSVKVDTLIRHNGDVIAHDKAIEPVELAAGSIVFETTFTLEQPELWWPNGHGDQIAYVAELIVHNGHHVFETRSVQFGVRQIEFVPNEGAPLYPRSEWATHLHQWLELGAHRCTLRCPTP
jgi:beta-mannosidase